MVGVEVKRAQRDGTPFAVAALDIDGFGRLDERLGREAADDLLRSVAAELVRGTRDTDLVARVKADDFVLVLLGVEGDIALSVIERLRAAVAKLGAGKVSSSVGWACYPADGHDPGTLVEAAEGALDWARRGGPGSVRRFDSRHVVLRGNEEQRAEVMSVLERDDGLTVVFQPIVNLSTGKIIGFEALARFPNGPQRGPDVRFAQAHRCGLGPQLEAQAVRQALLFPGRPKGTWLSVNLSPNALQSDELKAVLPQDLDGIVIELTEHEQIWDDEEVGRRLDDLRSRGAKIAVDDAGAGYAGLQQVMRIQPDVIKLDRSLIRGVDDDIAKAALIDSIVRFARRAGATVCGEGIETEEELRALADLDVSCGQGYLLARPGAPWPTVLAWVSETLLPRTLRRRGDSDSTHAIPQVGEQPLESVSTELAKVSSLADLAALAPQLALELDADEVVLLRHRREDRSLEPLSHVEWIEGDHLRVPAYRTLANVLHTQDSVQVLLSDPGGELGELALLGNSGHSSMLIVPVVSRGESVGALMALTRTERPWTRDQNGRARIVANQVGGLLEVLTGNGSLLAG
jgi:diguanylate cyclase (GGDEF)-like protein